MSILLYLSICLAVSIIPFRSKRTQVRAGRPRRHGVTASLLPWTAIMLFGTALSSGAAAQEGPRTFNTQEIAGVDRPNASPRDASPSTPDAIMGFESTSAWSVIPSGLAPALEVVASATRTQGNAAYGILFAPALMTVTSLPVASSATALTGIGNQGAHLQVDILLPSQCADAILSPSCNLADTGEVEAFVTSKSRGLIKTSLGKIPFNTYKPGVYSTFDFSIPGSVSTDLDAAFNDLVFEFTVSTPSPVTGAYLFDSLRVDSVELVQSPKGTPPPAGYGGSLTLVANGGAAVTKTFTLEPLQIPVGFHLKKGVAGATTVQFQLGLDSKPSVTCTYVPDISDKTNRSFKFQSCTGVVEAGDLVAANWLSLDIEKGDSTQQIDAQLALNPAGSLNGSGVLPPMPTFWGDSDTCAPTPVAGKVVTTSASCATQAQEANTILNDYFDQVKTTHPDATWIVAPVPESATRQGTGQPTPSAIHAAVRASGIMSPDDTPANDTTFDTGGDLNQGGSFDAYWKLSGNLEPTAVSGTDENTTHFDATFTAHGVLFGDDIDVVDAKLTADTDSGETTPAYKPAKSTGTLGFYVFGEEIPSSGITFSPSEGFSVDPSWSQEYDLPSIQIWIFSITLGADVEADLKANGSAALSGADLSITPTASVGGHISGGIDLGIADGEVDAKVNLITLSTPMSAQAKLALNTSPAICATQLSGSLKGDLDVSSGGGEVDLDATFGYCPFCYTDSTTLIKWNALANASFNLFNDALSYQAFGLPASLCPLATTANIVSPAAGSGLSAGIPITLAGSAMPTDPSVPAVDTSNTYKWTFTPGANASTATLNPDGANGATPSVIFGAPKSGSTSNWTINMAATTTVQSEGGAVLTKTTSAAPVNVTVTNLSPGDYITQVSSSNGVAIEDGNGVYQLGNVPQNITFSGAVAGASGVLNTTFSALYCNDYTPACSDPVTPIFSTITTTGGNTATPSAMLNQFEDGYFLITITTTSGGAAFHSASVLIYGSVLI
jgi:hypothetical protein